MTPSELAETGESGAGGKWRSFAFPCSSSVDAILVGPVARNGVGIAVLGMRHCLVVGAFHFAARTVRAAQYFAARRIPGGGGPGSGISDRNSI